MYFLKNYLIKIHKKKFKCTIKFGNILPGWTQFGTIMVIIAISTFKKILITEADTILSIRNQTMIE